MPIYSDEAQGLIHGPFRKHMGRPEDRTPLRSSVGLGSFGDVLRLRETQAIADGREADYSEAESQRRSAEVLRNMAEEGRQEAETTRETAEQGRQDAETTRSGSEASRVSSEEARVTAEQARVGAESARVTAEAGRVQAELERETNKITSASVSVDDNVGTPEATVTLGPPSSGGRSINFDFKNLKGDPVNLVPVTNGQIDTIAGDGTVTNDNVLTGTGLTYLWSWIKAKFASLVNGAVQIVQGGTGATTASGARNSLGVPTASSIASTENVTATRNHAVGDYFMLGDVLMKATAAIATGETINASKATPATVQSQIDTIRNSIPRAEHVYSGSTYAANLKSLIDDMRALGVGSYIWEVTFAGEFQGIAIGAVTSGVGRCIVHVIPQPANISGSRSGNFYTASFEGNDTYTYYVSHGIQEFSDNPSIGKLRISSGTTLTAYTPSATADMTLEFWAPDGMKFGLKFNRTYKQLQAVYYDGTSWKPEVTLASWS